MDGHRPTVRVLLTGGGSGGHLYPLLAVVEELKTFAGNKDILLSLTYFGPPTSFEQQFKEANIKVVKIVSGKIRRYLTPLSLLQNLIDIPKTLFGILQAFVRVFFLMPSVIFSKGGTGAFPVVLAGWFYRIPIVLHESDAIPGLTNLLSRSLATRIGVSFEQALQYFRPEKTALVGNPVRKELVVKHYDQKNAKEALGFKGDVPLLLALGGSQGSQRINEFITTILPQLLLETQLLHQTGKANFEYIQKLSEAELGTVSKGTVLHTYEPVAFFEENLPLAYAAADLVVARPGAGVLFEIAAFGKPAILIPLPEAANNHQRANAYEFATAGAAIVIEEDNLLPGVFLNQVKTFLKSPVLREKMAKASRAFFRPDAARFVAEEIIGLALGDQI